MADKELAAITDAGTLDGTERLYIVQNGNSREVSLDELAAYIKTAESIVPASLPWRGCRVKRINSILDATWPMIVGWEAEDIDTDGIWSAGDSVKLVVPTGVTKVRLTAAASVEANALSMSFIIQIRKNQTGTGADTVTPQARTTARNGSTGSTDNYQFAQTPVLNVVAGDYFDVRVNCSSTTINELLAGNELWFEMEIIEADVA